MCATAVRVSGSSLPRSSSSSIQPLRLESGVPSWCADSRAIPAHTRSRSAFPRVRNDVRRREEQTSAVAACSAGMMRSQRRAAGRRSGSADDASRRPADSAGRARGRRRACAESLDRRTSNGRFARARWAARASVTIERHALLDDALRRDRAAPAVAALVASCRSARGRRARTSALERCASRAGRARRAA